MPDPPPIGPPSLGANSCSTANLSLGANPCLEANPCLAANLGYLRKQAKALLRAVRSNDPAATARFRKVVGNSLGQTISLSRAQLVIAREAGFASWPKVQDELCWRLEVRAKHRLGSATPLKKGTTVNSNNSLELGPIDQIGLSCTDLEQAQQFYCDLLGLRHVADALPQMKFFGGDGMNIVMFKSDAVTPNSCIYFRVAGQQGLLEQKLAMLKSKGVKVESDAHVIARNWNRCNVWLAFFRDPFGNLLALKSDVPVK
jgi:catechol 2,3-dioxygenase-like lactoylglutathione lyase family enzyme